MEVPVTGIARSIGCEPVDDRVDTGVKVTAQRSPAEAHHRPALGLDGEVPGSILLEIGVKRGTVAFDVEAHAILFDREVEPVVPDTNASVGRDTLLQQRFVQTEFQRTVETGCVERPRLRPAVPAAPPRRRRPEAGCRERKMAGAVPCKTETL